MRAVTIASALLVLAGAVLAEGPEDVHEVTACEVCGGDVYQTPKEYLSGNTKYVYIDEPAHKPYCTLCQRDINNGKIDPDDPPALAPRDEEEVVGDNPWAVRELDVGRKKVEKDAHTKEAESGFGALSWVIGIVVVAGAMIRFFLK